MLLSECYQLFGGDYESVKQRISKEEIIEKFVLRFLTEPSYDNLCAALKEENYEEAFRAAHSLKGVSQNLGFERLSVSSGDMTEYLRDMDKAKIDDDRLMDLLDKVSLDYREVMDAVRRYAEK
ncbi:MAG: Hpt domain-containing protein [Lachnospiraceae bacterium]